MTFTVMIIVVLIVIIYLIFIWCCLKTSSKQNIESMHSLNNCLGFFQGEDLVPEPKVISAVLQACRKVNDYALAVRYLESVQVIQYKYLQFLSVIFFLLFFVLLTSILIFRNYFSKCRFKIKN